MQNQSGDEVGDRDYINSFARGLEVIRAFSRSTPKMTLSDVARDGFNTRDGAPLFVDFGARRVCPHRWQVFLLDSKDP